MVNRDIAHFPSLVFHFPFSAQSPWSAVTRYRFSFPGKITIAEMGLRWLLITAEFSNHFD